MGVKDAFCRCRWLSFQGFLEEVDEDVEDEEATGGVVLQLPITR